MTGDKRPAINDVLAGDHGSLTKSLETANDLLLPPDLENDVEDGHAAEICSSVPGGAFDRGKAL